VLSSRLRFPRPLADLLRAGLDAFVARYPRSRTLVVGGDEFPLERFLRTDPGEWLDGGHRPQSPRAHGVTGPH